MEWQGKHILVLGLARTGRECARFFVSRGATVSISDLRTAQELRNEMSGLEGLPLRYCLGGEERHWLDGIDCVVPSPGVPAANSLLLEAQRRKLPILSEIEVAYQAFGAPLIAITGTNGKSTTTTLIGEMLKADGRKVFVGGNLGMPFISAVSDRCDWGVVEISSFQLEWIESFKPRIALMLNVTADHLDRYASFTDYRRAKERIFANQDATDVAILNRQDPLVWELGYRLAARVVSFGFDEVDAGVFSEGHELVWREGENEERYSLARVKIQGVHNQENLMAAIAAAKCANVKQSSIERAIEAFAGLEHRLEFVREKDGVRFYNDSKGTNVGAVVKSLVSFDAPVILLAGGVDKGGGYAELEPGIRSHVRRLVLFGEAKNIICSALGAFTETSIVDDLNAAVRDAAAHARAGDVVLLSPACSSFDQFRNYAERGKKFKELVRAL